MDHDHFESLLRSIRDGRSRRGVLAGLSGGLLTLLTASLGSQQAAAKKKHKHHKHHKHKRCKTCGPCQQCQKGKCKGTLPDGTACANGTCQSGSCVAAPVCPPCSGDEVCSDGACLVPACGAGGPCRVFFSSTRHDGNLGGLSGADAICQSLAAAAGLGGTYQAWLSDDTNSPSSRFVHSTGPYRLVNGTTIAANFADLTDGTLLASIKVTETGVTLAFPDDLAWTNTRFDGARDDDNQTCANWTSHSDLLLGGSGRARRDSAWTDGGFGECSSAFHLYCFQQS